MSSNLENVIVIGSGPAGFTASIYTARANLRPIQFLGIQPGGQLTITTDVENYPGFAEKIDGSFLMDQMRQQTENMGTRIIHDTVTSLTVSNKDSNNFNFDSASKLSERHFIVETHSSGFFIAKAIILATGAQARWLGLESEDKYKGFGVSGCATCDGFFFRGKKVAVIGGGNTAVEEALYLTRHASEVILIHRKDSLRAEKVMQNRLFENKKIKILWNHEVVEFVGIENPISLTGVIVKNTVDGSQNKIDLDGVFVAIGHSPQSSLVKNLVECDEFGYVITKPNSTKTNIEGLFAAGDVQDKVYRQAITAAGQGCMAAIEVERFLEIK